MTKKYSDSEKKDKKAALKEITEQLEKSIHEFMNGEKYKNFLNQMSKFHSYSLNNQILIAIHARRQPSVHPTVDGKVRDDR